jgi:nucleoside-diphosphate-sugar epimerase
MKTVVVTGGAGYLGSHVVRILLQRGYQVRVIDTLWYGDAGIKDIIHEDNLMFLRGDICNIREMTNVIKGADAVIALAAIVGDPACALREDETLSVNYESTKVLVELCNYYGIRKLLFASSCSVYGSSSDITLNEGSVLNPVSLYAKTRIMSEEIIQMKSAASLCFTIFRLATLFGWSPRMRFDLAVNIIAAKSLKEKKVQIFGGTQWRPFVNVNDAARAFADVLEVEDRMMNRQIFNLGGDNLNHRIIELGAIAKQIFPDISVEECSDVIDRRDYKVSFDKAKSVLGFIPTFSVADGMKEISENIINDNFDYKNEIYYNANYLFR